MLIGSFKYIYARIRCVERFTQIKSLINDGEFTKALSLVNEILHSSLKDYLDNEDLSILYNYKATCLLNVNLEDAENALLKAIELDSDNSEAIANMGTLCYSNGLYEKSISYCKRALEIDNNEINAHMTLANSYFAIENVQKAYNLYIDYIKTRNDSPIYIYNIIQVEDLYGIFNKKELWLSKMKSDFEESIITKYAHVCYFLEREYISKVELKLLTSYLKLFYQLKHTAIADCLFGILAMRHGDLESAKKLFNQSLEVEQNNPAPYYYLAKIAYIEKSFDLSYKMCDKAMEMSDNNLTILINSENNVQFLFCHSQRPSPLKGSISYLMSTLHYHSGEIFMAKCGFREQLHMMLERRMQFFKNKKYKLYRFRPLNTREISALCQNTLWFSDLSYYNDSFEGELINSLIDRDKFHTLLSYLKSCCFFHNDNGFTDSKMWDIYGNRSNGLCIEYEFSVNDICPSSDIYFDNITYSTNYCSEDASLYWMIHNSFYRKHHSWKDEHEFRILHMGEELLSSGELIRGEYLGLSIKKIYFGRNVKDKDKFLITEKLPKEIEFYNIVAKNSSSFELTSVKYQRTE